MAHPTILADNLVPKHAAIAPYVVTLPLGICRATSNTNLKKDASRLPDGFTVDNLSGKILIRIVKGDNGNDQLKMINGLTAAAALPTVHFSWFFQVHFYNRTDNEGNLCHSKFPCSDGIIE